MSSGALTIIQEAKASGIRLTKIAELSKLDSVALDAELKQLRSAGQIAGPFAYGPSKLFYAKGYEPGGDATGRRIELLIRDAGKKLLSAKEVEKRINQPFKKFFKDGIRNLVANGRLVELKGGSSVFLLHVDAVKQLFPKITEASAESAVGADSSVSRHRVLEAYHHLKNEQGGLSAVSIGKLLGRLEYPKPVLHEFLLNEAHLRRADLHPSTSLELTPEDRDGAMAVPGKSEPAITVTFTE